jgi:hypothetical protein
VQTYGDTQTVLPEKTPAAPPHCPYWATGGSVLVEVAAELVEVELVLLVVLVVPTLLLDKDDVASLVVDVLKIEDEDVLVLLVLLVVLELEVLILLDAKVPVNLISLELAPTITLNDPDGIIQACVATSQ